MMNKRIERISDDDSLLIGTLVHYFDNDISQIVKINIYKEALIRNSKIVNI